MISIYTFTLGRAFYLNKLLRSVIRSASSFPGRIEHHLCCQGVKLDQETLALIEGCEIENLRFQVHEWPENVGTPAGVNKIVPELRGDLILKMDEDCLILSEAFFEHVAAVWRLKPNAIFSPYPVGLIKFAGGPKGVDHHVEYSDETDTHYTFRRVEHVGGFCRISPRDLVKNWRLTPGKTVHVRNEDQQYSKRCRETGIEMFYLENALVVEHQESSLGQEARFQDYFGGHRPEKKRVRLPRLRKALRPLKRSLEGLLRRK